MATLKINTKKSDLLGKMDIRSTRNIQYDVVFNSTTPMSTRQLFEEETNTYIINNNFVVEIVSKITTSSINSENVFSCVIDVPGSSIEFIIYPFKPNLKDKTKFGRLEIVKIPENNTNILEVVFSTVEISDGIIKKALVTCKYKYLHVGFKTNNADNIVVVFNVNFNNKTWSVSAPSEIRWLPQKKA